MEKEKLWTRDFISISIVNFAMMLSMYLLLVTMVSYVVDTYQTTTSMAGLVSSIFIIGVLLGRLYGGKEISQVGSKKMLIVGAIFFVMVTILYFIPSNIYVLLFIRFLHGVGVGLATTATGTIVSQIIPQSRKGEGISYFSISVVLSTAIGPLIGIGLIEMFGYTSIFIFSLVVGVISLLLALPVKEPIIEKKKEEANPRSYKLSAFFEPRALPISIVMFIAALAYSGILSFVTTYAADINLTGAGSIYFFVYAMATLILRPFTGKLMDLKGGNFVVYPTLVLFAMGMFLLSQAHSGVTFLIAAVVIGLGYGNFQSIVQALAIKVTPPHRMGLANSTFFIFMDLGIGIGPFLLGFIISHFGYRGMYVSMVPIILLGIVAYYFLYGKKEKEIILSRTGTE